MRTVRRLCVKFDGALLCGSVLSRCSHAVLALLYPFTWQHTFVPVLPASMLDISCSPTPFLIGVLAPCLPELLELPIEEVRVAFASVGRFRFFSPLFKTLTFVRSSLSLSLRPPQVLIVDLCEDKFVVQVCTHAIVSWE